MENEILINLKNLSFEIIVMALIVFSLTMVIKYPIKKQTSKLTEEKRKAFNTIIILIPIVLSFSANAIYQFAIRKVFDCGQYFEVSISINLLATFIYAVVSRIIDIIKAVKSGKIEINQDLSANVVKYIKKSVKTLNDSLKTDKKSLSDITIEMEKLLQIQVELTNSNLKDIKAMEQVNSQIKELKEKETCVNLSIDETNKKIIEFNKTLYKQN